MTLFPAEVVFDDLELATTRVQDFGGESTGVFYLGNPLRIQTPWTTIPWGIQEYEATPENKLHSLSLVIRKGSDLDKFLTEMDNFVERLNEFRAGDLFSLKRPNHKHPTAPHTLRLKIKESADTFKFDIFEGAEKLELTKKQTVEKLFSGQKVQAIIQAMPIWYSGKSYGMTFRLCKIRLRKDFEFK